jgi:Cof subfamily protein (haloacid dehalogenase superfamily)
VSAALPPGLDPAAVRAVATDMDRTILPSSLELSPATVRAIARVRRAGIEAIIATGRMFASTRPYALQLGITAPVICYQGALIVDPVTGEWLQHRPIDVPVALEVIAAVRREGFHMNVYVDDQLCVEKPTPEARTYAEHARLEMVVVGNFDTWLHQPTTKIVIVGEPGALDDLEQRLRSRFDDRLFIAKSLPIFLEVASPGVSKGAALHFVCERLGIDPAATIAFGDGANDLELLEAAGLGVAVADAEPALLRIADWTVPPVGQDGVAGFLDRLVDSRA